jgi:hypothetical protein
VVDTTGVLFHEVMRPTVQPGEAAGHLRRFLAGDATVANLDREASLSPAGLQYFPFWAFTVTTGSGEQVVLEPAAPSSLQGLQGLTLPAGDTCKMSPENTGDTLVREPEVPLSTARQWLDSRFDQVTVTRTVLYHLPLYRISYTWKGKTYQAAVDGASGRVLPADFPAKAETPYVMVAGLALLAFGIEGLLVSNLFAKLLLYTVSALPIIGIAWLTTRKV